MNARDFRKELEPPNLAPPPPTPVLAQDFESNGRQFVATQWPKDPTRLYSFKKRWRAVDVYVQVLNPDQIAGPLLKGGCFSVFVYAINQVGLVQTRVLVASGRLDDPQAGTTARSLVSPKWICAHRSVAQQFEVDVVYSHPGVTQPDVSISVTCIGSDEAIEPPSHIGVIRIAGAPTPVFEAVSNAVGVNSQYCPNPELVGLSGMINSTVVAPAPRYLMIFDWVLAVPGTLPPNGTVPIFAWPLGSSPGDGIFDQKIKPYRADFQLNVLASSTAAALTLVNDCTIGCEVR